MSNDVQHDEQWSRMSFDMDYLLGALPTDPVILRFIDDVRWLRAQLVESEATLATIGGADKATLARKLRRANAATRDAKQRAAAAEAVKEAFGKALVSIIMERYVRYDGHPDTPLHMVEQAYAALIGVPLTFDDIVAVDHWTREEAQAALDALAAPATQPDERAAAERDTDERAAEAWADKVALFILHKVTEATSLTLADITPNLTAPDGWLSFARLWRADYIIVTGDLVQPTERGMAAMRELLICVADVELDATDGAAKERT